MTTTDETPDLFRHKPAQGDLFANEPGPNPGVYLPDPDRIRRRLHKLLAQARAAESKSPWNERDTRMWRTVFPQMANWLPHAEAEQLRLEFRTELERLGGAHNP
jgi:hypothetical protein